MEGMEKEASTKKEKKKDLNQKNIDRSSLVQEMSDPFEDFPRTQPFDCINVTQR